MNSREKAVWMLRMMFVGLYAFAIIGNLRMSWDLYGSMTTLIGFAVFLLIMWAVWMVLSK